MANLNSSGNGDGSVENTEKKKRGDIQMLLTETINSEMCIKGGDMIDPTMYNRYTGNIIGLRNEIRNAMKVRAGEGEFADITEDEVVRFSDSKILYKIQQKITPLITARDRAISVLERSFHDIYNIVPEKKLKETLFLMNEAELGKVLYTQRSMYQFFQEKFGISRDKIQARIYEFSHILGTLTDDQRAQAEGAIIQYKKFGTQVPPYILERLLETYGTDEQRRKELCKIFDIEFTIRDAYILGLITDKKLGIFIEDHITSAVWNKLDQSEKNRLLLAYRRNDSIRLHYDDLDGPNLAKLLIDSTLKNLMVTEAGKNLARNIIEGLKEGSIYTELKPDTRGDYHTSFLELIQGDKGISSKLSGVTNLKKDSVITFLSENNTEIYIKITATDVDVMDSAMPDGKIRGVRLAYLNGREKGTIGREKGTENFSYDDFYEFLKNRIQPGTKVISGDVFDQYRGDTAKGLGILQDEESKLKDVSLDEENYTIEWLIGELDVIDPEGKEVGLKVGTAFSAKGTLDSGEEYEGVWTISDLDGSHVTIKNGRYTEEVPYIEFAKVAGNQNLRRIENVGDDATMIQALKDYGVDDHAEMGKDGDILTHIEEDDGHGHHKKVPRKYEFFQSEAGGHIRIGGFKNGQVFFGEFNTTGLDKIQKAGNAGKLSGKQKDSFYDRQTMSYGQFLQYLKKEKLKATTDNLLHPDATSRYKPQEPHLEGSLLSKMGKWWSVADIMKGFGNLTHAVEHYFEKTSKLNASRVALAMGRKLNLPMDMMAQLQADEVGSIKEIIEKYQEKLRNLNGPIAREKALHMAHNKNARPEEVAAAMFYMLKSYGQLYAEDIAYAQGSESFINGFMIACGYTGASLVEQKKKAGDKAKTMIGDEGEAPREPTEEEMIWAFCKSMDGAYDENPTAATIVKAMGGPSGYEAAWRKDGTDGAIEKGVRQAGDLVNARARGDHGLSALITHEYHTAIGSMESTASKTPHPSYQTVPIIWALGGYSKYLSTKGHQKVKSYADGKGHSMHAFAFLRSHEDNNTYREVFRLALSEVANQSEVEKLDSWLLEIEKDGHTKPSKAKKEAITAAINGIADLWRKYNDRGLHDNLQGKNTWLVEKASESSSVKKYLKRFSDIHQNNDGETPHSPDNDWNIQMGYAWSPLVESVEVDGHTVQSLWRTLKKVKINSQSMNFSDRNHIERFWEPSIEKVLEIKKGKDKDLQRAQYFQYRKDILRLFNDSVSAYWSSRPDAGLSALLRQGYARDFNRMGIDPSIIFTAGDFDMRADRTAEADFQKFLYSDSSGIGASGPQVIQEQESVKSFIDKALTPQSKTQTKRGGYDADEIQPTAGSGGAIYDPT